MEGVSEPGSLGSSVLSWLTALQLVEPAPGDPLLLPVELGQVAAICPRLVQLLLEDAERVRVMAVDALAESGAMPRAHPLWLRPRSLLALRHTPTAAAAVLRTQPKQQLNIQGLCCASSAVFQRKYSSTYACTDCGKQNTVLEGEPLPTACCCCAGPVAEALNLRVMVKAQIIMLGAVRRAGQRGGPLLEQGPLPVLLLDDLCGAARVGDVVLACCAGRRAGPAAPDRRTCGFGTLWSVQADALGVTVLPPGPALSLPDLPLAAQQHAGAMASGDLDAVLAAAAEWLGQRGPILLHAALLLSCAAAGAAGASGCGRLQLEGGKEEEEGFPISAQRRGGEVHVMLFSQEPIAGRLAERLASALCRVSVRPGLRSQLLPQLEARSSDPDLHLPAPLAWGGQLGEANHGVLLLPAHLLDAKAAAAVAGYAQAGEAALEPPEPALPITASVWCSVEATDLGRGPSRGVLWAEQVAAKLGNSFLGLFDLALDCDELENAGAAGARADEFLDSGEELPPGASAGQQAALEALQYHVQVAQALPPPQLMASAVQVLSTYFLSLRSSEQVSQEVTGTLVRLASASARLRHRLQVETADAALAVALVEESILAKGGAAAHWPQWRRELLGGAPLLECLAGLLHSLASKSAAQGMPGAPEQ